MSTRGLLEKVEVDKLVALVDYSKVNNEDMGASLFIILTLYCFRRYIVIRIQLDELMNFKITWLSGYIIINR